MNSGVSFLFHCCGFFCMTTAVLTNNVPLAIMGAATIIWNGLNDLKEKHNG